MQRELIARARSGSLTPGRFASLPVVICLGLLVGVWQLVVSLGLTPGYLLPPPRAVAAALVTNWQVLLDDALYTGSNALTGVGLAVGLALVLATILVHLQWLRGAVVRIVVGLEALPKIAFAPFLVLWLGIGSASKVAIAASLAFLPLLVSLLRGMGDVEDDIAAIVRVLQANWWRTLIYIRLPNSVVPFFDGLRIAIPGAVIGSILGEFISSDHGLGHRVLVANSVLRLDLAFAVLIAVGSLSIGLYQAVAGLERRLLRWRP